MGSETKEIEKVVKGENFIIMGSGMEVVEKKVIVISTLPEGEMEFDMGEEDKDEMFNKIPSIQEKQPAFTFAEKDAEPDYIADSDEEEEADIVSPLTPSNPKDISEAQKNFDRNLELIGERKYSIQQRDRKSTLRGNRESEIRGSKVNELIFRASNLMKLNQMRSTLIKSTSNQTNFDHKHLRYQDVNNRNFKKI